MHKLDIVLETSVTVGVEVESREGPMVGSIVGYTVGLYAGTSEALFVWENGWVEYRNHCLT